APRGNRNGDTGRYERASARRLEVRVDRGIEVVPGVVRMLRGGKRQVAVEALDSDMHARRVGASVAQISEQVRTLLLAQLDDRVVVRIVDDDPDGTSRESFDLVGRKAELEIMHGCRRLLAGETLFVLGDAGNRQAVVQPDRNRPLDADELRQPLVEPFLVV